MALRSITCVIFALPAAKTAGRELVTVRALGEIAPRPGCTLAR